MHQAMQRAGASVVRSVIYSALAATILMTLGFLLAHVMRDRRQRLVNFLTLALFAIPGTVLSIGLVRLLEHADDMVHLHNSGAVDTRVHRTILRRHNKTVAGGIFSDFQIIR